MTGFPFCKPLSFIFYPFDDFINDGEYACRNTNAKQQPKYCIPTETIGKRAQAVRAYRAAHVTAAVQYPCDKPRVDFTFHKQRKNTRD